MKKKFVTFLPIVFILTPFFAFAADAPADTTKNQEVQAPHPEAKSTVQNPAEKLNRGIINIVTAPIEIAKQIDASWKKSSADNKSVGSGIFSGFFKGIANTVKRAGSGAWDVVSFPFKTSENHEPLMKPEFVLDQEK